MNISKIRCCYCGKPREFSADLHGCPESLKAQAYLASVIGDIHTSMHRPGNRELTSNEMNSREDRRHEYATAIKVTGGEVRPEAEQFDKSGTKITSDLACVFVF